MSFLEWVNCHPAHQQVGHQNIQELRAYSAYVLSSIKCVLRNRHASQMHIDYLNVFPISIRRRKLRTLLCRGTLRTLLVCRLLGLLSPYSIRNTWHYTHCVISRSHFLLSKNAAQNLFEMGQRFFAEQRYSEAFYSWGQAAIMQHTVSHAFISQLLIEGRRYVKKDPKLAFSFAQLGAELGCVHSKGVLGYCLISGKGASNVEDGLKLARESAAAGSSFGQFALGEYYNSWSIKNYVEAVRWLKLAATRGHSSAQHKLGLMYEWGQGVPKDFVEAIRWHRLAAAQGHADALFSLGCKYEFGHGVAIDRFAARTWYERADAQGHPEANEYLSRIWRIIEGVS